MYTILGSGRIIDFNEENATCRVRLLDSNGLPTGKVYAAVKIARNVPELRMQIQQEAARGSTWSAYSV